MLVCTDESDDPNIDVEETSEQTSHKKDKKFVFNHGGKYCILYCVVYYNTCGVDSGWVIVQDPVVRSPFNLNGG
jgi:hypothetical protein